MHILYICITHALAYIKYVVCSMGYGYFTKGWEDNTPAFAPKLNTNIISISILHFHKINSSKIHVLNILIQPF